MRALSTQELLTHIDDLPLPAANWGPVVDNVELLDHPANLVMRGAVTRVPTLMGSNADEGTMFTKPLVPVKSTQEFVNSTIQALWGTERAKHLFELYPFANYSSPFYAASAIVGDFTFGCPRRRTARWLSLLDHSGQVGSPGVYAYYFSHTPVSTSWLAPSLKCFHGAELIYLFGIPSALWGSAEHTLSRELQSYWSNFAATGNPNLRTPTSPPTAVTWPAYNLDAPLVMNLNAPKLGTVNDNEWKTAQCDYFDSYAPIA